MQVYFDEASARLYQDTGRHPSPFSPSTPPSLSANSLLNWDGKLWEIVNRGESSIWLKDDAGSVISLSEQTLSNLISQGSAQVVAAPPTTPESDGKSARELLARASGSDLAEANRRYAILTAYRAGGWNQELGVTLRTIQRWEADARQAEAVYQCGYAGLLPRIRNSGNRTPRLPEETRRLMIELVCSQTGANLGRPWASFMTDAFSRRLLAVYLSFDPPSYRSCMIIFRECVGRHHRLHQMIVIDGGGEFESVYFETLLARYEIVAAVGEAGIDEPSNGNVGSGLGHACRG